MRRAVILSCLLLAGCEIPPENAPIAFKISQTNSEIIDGVELSVLCELSQKIGTEFRAAEYDEASQFESEAVFSSQRLLNVGEVYCGGQDEPIGLPFTLDEQKGLVSTWSELPPQDDEQDTAWGSCLADLTRPEGDRVILCEIGTASSTPNLPFNLNPDQPRDGD
ncbi:MAG: hypothetical protein QNI84_02675 [Henriciella sp.]|nr:hypothetical protein [Henriciella sp.]